MTTAENSRHNCTEFETMCLDIEAPLYSYILRMTGNRSEAEDVAQESLLRLFRALQEGKLKQSPRSYVFSIAHNLMMDLFRRQQRALPEAEASAPSPEGAVERMLLREQLDLALHELPGVQREALLLREFGGMNYQEIAATLGCPLGQVKIWIYRGRKRLAQLIDRDGQYLGNRQHGT